LFFEFNGDLIFDSATLLLQLNWPRVGAAAARRHVQDDGCSTEVEAVFPWDAVWQEGLAL